MKKLLVVSLELFLFSFVYLSISQSQTSQALGSVSGVTPLRSCPYGFYRGASCYLATVSCPGTTDIQVTYGYSTPSGNPHGTIVMFDGAGGTEAYGTGDGQRSYA